MFKQKPAVNSYVGSQLFSTQINTNCSDAEYLRDKLTLNDLSERLLTSVTSHAKDDIESLLGKKVTTNHN